MAKKENGFVIVDLKQIEILWPPNANQINLIKAIV